MQRIKKKKRVDLTRYYQQHHVTETKFIDLSRTRARKSRAVKYLYLVV